MQRIDLWLIGLFPIKCDVYYDRVQGVQGTYKQRNLAKIIVTLRACCALGIVQSLLQAIVIPYKNRMSLSVYL